MAPVNTREYSHISTPMKQNSKRLMLGYSGPGPKRSNSSTECNKWKRIL